MVVANSSVTGKVEDIMKLPSSKPNQGVVRKSIEGRTLRGTLDTLRTAGIVLRLPAAQK